jgi:hypothetical protein
MDIRGYVDVDVDVDVGGLDMPIIQSNPIHSEPYAFGVAPGAGYPDSLGNIMASEYLGPAKSNTLSPITFTVTLPQGTQNGRYTLSASVMSLYGVEHEPVLSPFNTTITVAGY